MNYDNLNEEEIRLMEAEVKARQNKINPIYQHYGPIENLSSDEIRLMEAEVKARQNKIDPIYQHYGSVENLSSDEIRQMEAEVKARQNKIDPIYQHYGSVENLSSDEIRQMEAEVRASRNQYREVYQHYGPVENLDSNDLKILEAQVAKQRAEDIPYKEYLNNLINNPVIVDYKQFEDAVVRSMQSNGIMRSFATKIVEEISSATYGFKNIAPTDVEKIAIQKNRLESLVNVYVRFLYELKKNDWVFSGAGSNIGLQIIDSDMLDDISQVQKRFDIQFKMPIPKNLGEYYGESFERDGKMIPSITLMYDDLKNKEVNWHQVLIYKENELTPQQRYKLSQEEKRKEFELIRQEEMKKTLELAKTQMIQNGQNVINPEDLVQENNFGR